jgi:hypothetical protein
VVGVVVVVLLSAIAIAQLAKQEPLATHNEGRAGA